MDLALARVSCMRSPSAWSSAGLGMHTPCQVEHNGILQLYCHIRRVTDQLLNAFGSANDCEISSLTVHNTENYNDCTKEHP